MTPRLTEEESIILNNAIMRKHGVSTDEYKMRRFEENILQGSLFSEAEIRESLADEFLKMLEENLGKLAPRVKSPDLIIDFEGNLTSCEPSFPAELEGLWLSDADRDLMQEGVRLTGILPEVPQDRPIPGKFEIEAKIPGFREQAKWEKVVTLGLLNKWYADFDPFVNPLENRTQVVQLAVACLSNLRGVKGVKVKFNLNAEYLVQVTGRYADIVHIQALPDLNFHLVPEHSPLKKVHRNYD